MIEKLEGPLYMNGYDDCIIGHIDRCGEPITALYSTTKLVERHMKDGMSYSEAVDFMEFNQRGSYVGDNTPHFLLDDLLYDLEEPE